MPIVEQKLKKIHIENLKGLKDLEIDFTEKPLVAILGPNGSGKSTILHALACVNNPVAIPNPTVNYKLSNFFTPTSHSIWTGSRFYVYQDFRDSTHPVPVQDHRTNFRKNIGRWAPRYVSRIERYVSYIGIKTCVPVIEKETQKSRIIFNTTPLNTAKSNRVRLLAGYVMNRDYTGYNRHQVGHWKEYIGVSIGAVNYSSLSMGAGEQRIFHILTEAINAPRHGLLLIDEIDLLLHQDALHRLMDKLNEIALERNLQIIFTTHAQSILSLGFIAVRHLYQTPTKTLCFNQTNPDALQRLSGVQERPLEIFVEDDLAAAMIKKICSQEGMGRYVAIKLYGAAINCFSAVAGSILNGLANQENMLFVLDGDEYNTDQEKHKRIASVLTGTAPQDNVNRQNAFSRIKQFALPNNYSPEQYYHALICGLEDNILTAENLEIVTVARQINNPGNGHRFFNDIITRMDFSREVGLNKLVELLAMSNEWNNVKGEIKAWLDQKRQLVI